MAMDLAANVRQFKDFLLLYNHISERCFNLCINGFNDRTISTDESTCVDRCVGKHIHANHKIMSVYAELQPVYMQRRIDEMNQQMEAQQAAQEASIEQTQQSVQEQQQQQQ